MGDSAALARVEARLLQSAQVRDPRQAEQACNYSPAGAGAGMLRRLFGSGPCKSVDLLAAVVCAGEGARQADQACLVPVGSQYQLACDLPLCRCPGRLNSSEDCLAESRNAHSAHRQRLCCLQALAPHQDAVQQALGLSETFTTPETATAVVHSQVPSAPPLPPLFRAACCHQEVAVWSQALQCFSYSPGCVQADVDTSSHSRAFACWLRCCRPDNSSCVSRCWPALAEGCSRSACSVHTLTRVRTRVYCWQQPACC